MTAPAINEYLRAAVETASPAALHGMIVDAAVRHAAAAADHLTDGPDRDEAAGWKALDKAVACVAELTSGVRPKAAGPNSDGAGGWAGKALAEDVQARFAFCLERLDEAGRTNAAGPARDAARVLAAHAETWRELLTRGTDAPDGSTAETAGAVSPPHAAPPAPVAFSPAPAPAVSAAAPRSWAA